MWICADKRISTLAPSHRIPFYHQVETLTLGYVLHVWSWEKLRSSELIITKEQLLTYSQAAAWKLKGLMKLTGCY